MEQITIHSMSDKSDKKQEKEDEKDGHWKSCCLEVDRQMVVYFGQLAFSFAILAFSALMLYEAKGSCEKSSPYIGLISFLLGKLLSSVTDSTRR